MEKSKRNKIIVNAVISVTLLALAVVYLTQTGTVTFENFKSINFTKYLIVFAFFVLAILTWAVVDFLVYRTVDNTMPYHRCVINLTCGNLGSNITPFKSGHFPLMAYYRFNAGVSLSQSVTGLVRAQIIYSVTSMLVYLVLLIVVACLKLTILFQGVTVYLWWVMLVGFSFHFAVCLGIVLLSFIIPLQNFALKLWSKILFKFKNTGNREEYILEKQEKFRVYREQIKEVFSRFLIYLPSCLVYAVFMIIFGSFQYVSYLAISGNSFTFTGLFTFFVLNLAQTYITNIVPVPGGVGTAEVLFTLVFASVIPDTILASVMILWRVGTYYAVVGVEAILVPIVLFVKRKPKTDDE